MTKNACQSCDGSAEWHARKADHLEETIGPDAARLFLDDHPEQEEPEEPDDGDHSPEDYSSNDAWSGGFAANH